ncbi:MAG: hypothetical protein EA376_02005 [Phycisphaeraceae bacterium]|nr:MAG: hypothetical protein EA376_02005 [Phycisphaeraceae bacterium]
MPVFSSSAERHGFLTAWARFVTGRPWLTLCLAAALAAGGILISLGRLEFRSDRSELIDPALPWQQRYADYKARFPGWNDLLVAIDAQSAPPEVVEAFIEELVTRLKGDARFSRVVAGFETSEAPAGLILAEPPERIERIADDVRRLGPALVSSTPEGLLSLAAAAEDLDAERRAELASLLARMERVGRGEAGAWILTPPDGTRRFVVGDDELIVLMTSLAEDGEQTRMRGMTVNAPAEGIAALRAHLRAVRTMQRFATIEAGVTGVPVLEADEATQSLDDASKATALALALIAILMMFVYRGAVVPLLAIASLLLGVAWSFGWLTLAVGHLQLLSVVFVVILLGLGVDTAIHLIARLELVHPDHDHMPDAVAQAFRGVGPGVMTGALTTAAAFGATALTSFKGVAEMGLIAMGGVILCTIAVMSCFPALLEVLPHPERHLRARPGGEGRPYMRGALNGVDHRPRLTLGIWLIAIGVCGWLALGVRYDPDLVELMPENAESVRWERRLERADQQSVWHAVVVAESEAEAQALTTQLRALDVVADVGAAGMLFPKHVEEKRAILRTLPRVVGAGEADAGSLRRAAETLAARWSERDESIAAQASSLASLDDAGLAQIGEVYARERAALGERMEALRQATPPGIEELPTALREQWVGVDGSLLLRIYPAAPTDGGASGGPLSPERLGPFAKSVLATAPMATGPTIQIHESTRLIGRAYMAAAGMALGAILLILLLDFRNIGDALCVLIPVAVAIVTLLAVMRLTGTSLNFANMVVMPLIVGMGVDAGVHAVHRWRQQPLDKPAGMAGGSGRAITMTTATTAIGFACMMTGAHRGIWSLGFVMTVGLVLVWAACALLLPAVLRLRTADAVVRDAALHRADAWGK